MRDHRKLNGIYYTPQFLAKAITAHLHPFLSTADSLLEPSVGGGVFLDALQSHTKKIKITAIDIDQSAIDSIRDKHFAQFIHGDFISYDFLNVRFDVIIGNPPYISWKNASENTRLTARNVLKKSETGLTSTNLWGIFLLKSESLLQSDGIVSFVLPSDIKETDSGIKLLTKLLSIFERIELFEVPKSTFDHADQDTVIFCGYKKSTQQGLFIGKLNEENLHLTITEDITERFNKFPKASFAVHNDLFDDLFKMYCSMPKVGDICSTSPGIVTAANNFFIVPKSTALKLGIHNPENRIISKGQMINGDLAITEQRLELLENNDVPIFLLNTNSTKTTNKHIKEYLDYGVSVGLTERYKMKHRKPWHRIPQIWTTDCVFFKRTHLIPKLAVNEANALVTDAAYRILFNNKANHKSFICSFYNSFTLLFAELIGRKYAGGVLEITPNEFKSLPIPYTLSSDATFENFKNKFNADTRESIIYNDRFLFKKYNILDHYMVIRKTYAKLLHQRLGK